MSEMEDNKRMIVRRTPGSTAIDKIGWNPLTQQLNILFAKNGRYPEYVFGGISKDLAQSFMMARSVGAFYHDNIKKNSNYTVNKPFGSFRLGALGRRARNVFRFR
jgi:hypothetical protein